MGDWPNHGETHVQGGLDPIPFAPSFGEWQVPALLPMVEAQADFGYREEPGNIVRWRGSLRVKTTFAASYDSVVIIDDLSIPNLTRESLHSVSILIPQGVSQPLAHIAGTLTFNTTQVLVALNAPFAMGGELSVDSIINFDGITYSI
jgi:hypothetical protein